MFTGLIEEIGVIDNVTHSGSGFEIRVKAQIVLQGIVCGDSISINGACQTVTSFDPGSFTVFASQVTLSVTTLSEMKKGNRVNLERAIESGKRFGGHIVQGHVDGKGRVIRTIRDERGLSMTIGADPGCMRYIVAKGSVAVNGVSLTVVSENGTSFDLYLIPETLDRTTIPILVKGENVNIETDVLAKYCEKLLAGSKEGNLMKTLGENGYL